MKAAMVRKAGLALAIIFGIVAIIAWALSAPHYPAIGGIGDATRTPGSVIAVERVGGHNQIVLRALLRLANLPVATPVTDGAEMFRIHYWSQIDGTPVEASGLVSLPYRVLGGERPRGLVMYLHGTSPDRSASPSSTGAVEGLLPTAVFAGGGYTLLAPDYIGLGQSRAGQAYIHAGATAAAARDLVVAAKRVTAAMHLHSSPDLYLVGFSQGGHATAVVQRALEAQPLPDVTIKAAAAVAGAFDLAGISVPYAFAHKHSLYLAHSYAVQYHQRLASLLGARYAALLPTLFDGDHSVGAISAALPPDPRTLFRPEALAEILSNRPNWFTTALADNEAFRWRPKAPLRLYFGDRDTDVSPQDSKHFHAVARQLGGNIAMVPLGAYDHGESALRAVPLARLWFDGLSTSSH
jgi:pimeloyl-ACP methyl ester carboxylesterase